MIPDPQEGGDCLFSTPPPRLDPFLPRGGFGGVQTRWRGWLRCAHSFIPSYFLLVFRTNEVFPPFSKFTLWTRFNFRPLPLYLQRRSATQLLPYGPFFLFGDQSGKKLQPWVFYGRPEDCDTWIPTTRNFFLFSVSLLCTPSTYTCF